MGCDELKFGCFRFPLGVDKGVNLARVGVAI